MPRRLRALLAALAVAVGIAMPAVAAAPAFASGDDYPWKYDQSWGFDPWGFTMRQCVSFAAWRLHQHGVNLNNYTQGWGDATHWDYTAARFAYPVGVTPVVGAIAQWHAWERSAYYYNSNTPNGTLTAGPYGHVAYVEGVYPDGSVLVEQYNMNDTRSYSVARVKAPRYLYIGVREPVQLAASIIGGKYNSLGGPRGFLGNPTSGVYALPYGWGQNFWGGQIFWSARTGVHEVHGDIDAHFKALGGPTGLVGLPTTDEFSVAGGRASYFSGANLYWSPTTRAHEVHGFILNNYLAVGGPGSKLQLPTSDEYAITGGRASNFQQGTIDFTWSTMQTRLVWKAAST